MTTVPVPPVGLVFQINEGMGAIYFALFLVGIPLFIHLRRWEPIKSRGWVISVVQMSWVAIELALRIMGYTMVGCAVDMLRNLLLVPLFLFPYYLRVFELWYRFNLQTILLTSQTKTFKGRIILWIQEHPWLISLEMQLGHFVMQLLATIAVSLGLYYTHLSEVQAQCGLPEIFILEVIQGTVAIIFFIISCVVLWDVNDAYLLKLEFVLLLIIGLPFFILFVISSELLWPGFANPGFWVNLIEIGFFCATILLPIYGTRNFSNLLRKVAGRQGSEHSSELGHASRSLLGVEEDLQLVLGETVLQRALEQFMVQSWTIENLLFLRKADEYREATNTQKAEIALIIQQDFIREGSLAFFLVDVFCFVFSMLFLSRSSQELSASLTWT